MRAIRHHSTAHEDWIGFRNAAILGLAIGALAWVLTYKEVLPWP